METNSNKRLEIIGNSWDQVLNEEINKPYFGELLSFLNAEEEKFTIYPPRGSVFNAFKWTPMENVKVVIVGQDPYHGAGQAMGASFSVQPSAKVPPSLVNIFKELHTDLNLPIPENGDLSQWGHQGVLLLNAVLTVRAGEANSHQGKGWENFTDTVIKILSKQGGIVFILWGNFAKKKEELIDLNRNFVIKSSHPSPFSASYGFFGSRPFSKTNEYLEQIQKTPIDWDLTKGEQK
ncbi:uracil-DNA glycosylase [Xylocopilactobacillus apicola]|uniref:Uracil-DNA glycosylase n=1 Tax=Xylocopilactobacillus apicola TaxID=2932184 RepID=A0AAU9D693_9LACO|nr:uracil-DNA glycosylase [Xylocopilactobacillus apicola]BDR59068.1 uracil-DNA glycosylase [Xylocopilactobacillus apicola]